MKSLRAARTRAQRPHVHAQLRPTHNYPVRMSSSWKAKLVEVGEAAVAALAKADASTTRRAFARIVRSPSWREFRVAFVKAFPTKGDFDASAAAVEKELAKTFLGADQLAAYSLKGQHMPKADAQARDVCVKARTKAVRRVKYIVQLVRAFYSHAAGPLVDDYAVKYKLWHDDVAKLARVKAARPAPKTDAASHMLLVKMARKNEKLAKEGRDEAFEKLVAEYGSSKAAAVRGGLRDAEYSDVSSRISECSLSDEEEEDEEEEDGDAAAAAEAKVAAAEDAAAEAKKQLKEQKTAAAAALKAVKVAAEVAAAAAKMASNTAAAAAAKKLTDIAAATKAVDVAHAASVVAYESWQKSQSQKSKTAWQATAQKVTDAIGALKAPCRRSKGLESARGHSWRTPDGTNETFALGLRR